MPHEWIHVLTRVRWRMFCNQAMLVSWYCGLVVWFPFFCHCEKTSSRWWMIDCDGMSIAIGGLRPVWDRLFLGEECQEVQFFRSRALNLVWADDWGGCPGGTVGQFCMYRTCRYCNKAEWRTCVGREGVGGAALTLYAWSWSWYGKWRD